MSGLTQWIVLRFETGHEAAEVLTDYLSSFGAEGIEVVDRTEFENLLEHAQTPDYVAAEYLNDLSEEVSIRAYFALQTATPAEIKSTQQLLLRVNQELQFTGKLYDDVPKKWLPLSEVECAIEQRLTQLSEFFPLGRGYLGHEIVTETDWAENWKQYYQTLKYGRLVINPSWLEYTPAENEIVLQLDPGSAFGTGSHESTALMLYLLDQLDFDLIPPGAILDLGTGSGILAIAAAKLTTRAIDALDIDERAAEVARKNCALNQVNVNCRRGELKHAPRSPYALIMANLTVDIHVALMAAYRQSILPGGLLMLSGMINTRICRIYRSLYAHGFEILHELKQNDWHAIIAMKKAELNDAVLLELSDSDDRNSSC